MTWKSAKTAPTDGSVFEGRHDRLGEFTEPRRMKWGVGVAHEVEGDTGAMQEAYVVNGGAPWWLNEDGVKMAPSPTQWRPLNLHSEGAKT